MCCDVSSWIPAFAGMTQTLFFVTPADAGVQ
jgi:hypothetical protein